MPQLLLPLLSSEISYINGRVTVYQKDGQWTYFLGDYPIYSHKVDDLAMFRLTIAQLIDSGACRQTDIIKTFGVSKSSVIRAQRKYRENGSNAFFKQRSNFKKKGTVLTPAVIEQAQNFLNEGLSRKETAEQINVKPDTLRKAINDGRLQELEKSAGVTVKSTRTEVDAAESDRLGTACTRVQERTLAAFGAIQGVPVCFEPCMDVPKGGVLSALPALLANGLMEGTSSFMTKVRGYYTAFHVLLLLSLMALCRIKTVEKIRGESAGEFGKLLGLDRIPEVRCLRKKLNELSTGNTAEKWALHLSRYWMELDTKSAGTLYIDGHVRLYHGGLTKLPRRYVSRERLCLRGTTDYWVNDAVGQPFFVVEKTVDPGLLQTLRSDIVPRLLKDIPNQPTESELTLDPYLSRFILVFDREGYSPAFFQEMWKKHRISCMTYHKHPGGDWPEEWFEKVEVSMPNGETIAMKLAEMGSLVGTGRDAMWMREVRKLTKSGHQTSLISTEYQLDHTRLGARMFSRWCQENFFRYMMEHFAIDLLQEYGTQHLPATEKVINPAWRELNRSRASVQNKLRYRRAKFGEMTMHPISESNVKKYEKWVVKKADLFEQIEQYEKQLETIKAELKNTEKHTPWEDLDKKDQFYQLLPGRKRLMDTIKMIAYRAETSMGNLLRDETTDMAAARRLLQDLYSTEADILPQPENGRLLIRIHNASRPAANKKIQGLLKYLNDAEINFPGTQLRLYYELVSKDLWEEKFGREVS
jgi:DNA invertase Pin-like site-specific DNA recombinase